MCVTQQHVLSTSLWSSGGLSETNWARSEPRVRNFCCSVNIWVNNSRVREKDSACSSLVYFITLLLLLCTYSVLHLAFLVCSADHITTSWPDGNFFPPFSISHKSSSYCSRCCLLLSLPLVPSLFLPQTDPVSVGECCMNQQYPAHPSHSLLLSLSLSLRWYSEVTCDSERC